MKRGKIWRAAAVLGFLLPVAAMAQGFVDAAEQLRQALGGIYQQRSAGWSLGVDLGKSSLKIRQDQLDFTVRSPRAGYVYVFYAGSRGDSFYLLFPNSLDSNNAIAAGESLRLPRPDWTITALGPAGTDRLLVLVTESPRDFGEFALGEDSISRDGPFQKLPLGQRGLARVKDFATLPARINTPDCVGGRGLARLCSSAFGAALLSVEEVE